MGNNNIDRLAALYERCAKLEREIVALAAAAFDDEAAKK